MLFRSLFIFVTLFSSITPSEIKPVYGIDGRTDEYNVPAGSIKTTGAKTAALFFKTNLTKGTNSYSITSVVTLQQSSNLCNTEPFLNQPSNAFCSGTLVGTNRFLTAGHCVLKEDDNNRPYWSEAYVVFGYVMTDANNGVTTFSSANVWTLLFFSKSIQ